jgi:hypothetical protein
MASNDPIASKARKPELSIEDAERFASQIRPSWELLGPDAAAAGFGLDDAPGVAAPAPSAGAGGKAADTIIDGIPTVAVAGSDDSVPIDTSWDEEPAPAVASAPAAPPIEPQVIASIGIPSKAEVPVAELQLPPQVGHPMVPTAGAPIAPARAAKTKVGMGSTSGEREAIARPKSAPTSTKPAPVSAKAAAAPASARGATLASGKAGASKSRPGTTNPGGAYVPAAGEADDDIAIPISGASSGLVLKIGGGVAALAVVLIALKIFSGSSPADPAKPATTATAATTTTATAAAAPPPLDTTLVDPPKPTATAAAAAPTAATTATAAPTTAPTVKEKPVVAKVEPTPPPVPTVKKTPAAPPVGAGTPPAGPAKKKGGGIIRETPF